MFFLVYQIRARGRRLSAGELRVHRPQRGWLQLAPLQEDEATRMQARLLDQRGGVDLIVPLQRAEVRRLDDVMHLTGWEYQLRGGPKSQLERGRQSWLCAVDEITGRDALARVWRARQAQAGPFDDDLDDDVLLDTTPPRW